MSVSVTYLPPSIKAHLGNPAALTAYLPRSAVSAISAVRLKSDRRLLAQVPSLANA
jgi:hypothetical protein